MEKDEKLKHHKDLDVGRIIIEELPQEQEEDTKRLMYQRNDLNTRLEELRPRHTDETMKVGKLDVAEYDKISRNNFHFVDDVDRHSQQIDHEEVIA